MSADTMRSMRKMWLVLCCAGLICCWAGWRLYSRTAAQRRLAATAQATQLRAERGDAQAQFDLARMYIQGEGVPRNVGTARKWLRSAAEKGLGKAGSTLGSWYLHGIGVSQNDSEAFQWYRAAAEKGDAAGEYGVGYMYRHGRGVAKDLGKANEWTHKSAEQGDVIAQSELGYIYSKGQGVPQDYSRAAYWYRKAAEQGLAEAQSDIGYLEFYGYGIPRNRTEARFWFHKAAAQGDAYAKNALGVIWLGMSWFELFTVGAQLLGGVLLLTGSFLSRNSRLRGRSIIDSRTGILCIVSSGVWWFGYARLAVWSSFHMWILFRVIALLLDVVVVIFLIEVFRGGRAKRAELSQG